MGDAGEKGADATGKAADKAAKKVNKLGGAARKVGNFFGRKLKGILAATFAPIFAMVAGAAVFGGYVKDLSRIDELNKKASLSTEEMAEKQELLAMYSKEDQETFARLKKQTDSLTKQLKQGAASIMRLVVPAMEWMAKKFQIVFKIIKENKVFVITAILAIGVALKSAIIPALWGAAKAAWGFAAALLANPIAWFIVLGIALAAVLDDLWTYMNGGESALDGLWKKFGTGKELLEKFDAVVYALKETFFIVFDAMNAAAAFFDYFGPAIDSAIGYLGKSLDVLKALLSGNFGEPFESAKAAMKNLADFIINAFTGALSAVSDLFKKMLPRLADRRRECQGGYFRTERRGHGHVPRSCRSSGARRVSGHFQQDIEQSNPPKVLLTAGGLILAVKSGGVTCTSCSPEDGSTHTENFHDPGFGETPIKSR